MARIGRPDILWSVNKLARSITKWTKACDKRLNRLISYIHHTCEYKQYCHVGNTAKQCRLGLFQDSDFAGDLEDSKSTSGGTLCVFGSHTFVPISWMCKKQTAVSNSSTESEIISLDAGLRVMFTNVISLTRKSSKNLRRNNSPQGAWDNIADQMLLEFAESGHPTFRATTPLSKGILKSKGRGKLSIHFAADRDTIDTIYRIILSVNQLSVYGAVAAVCEEFESHQDGSGEPEILMGQSIVLGEVKAEDPFGKTKTP